MEERFSNFEVKRAEMFRELIKRAWYGNLDNQELNEILSKMQDKYGYKNDEISFLRDHIRLLMGLNPRGAEEFTDETEKIKAFTKVSIPIINKIDGICEQCDDEQLRCLEVCQYEDQIYRKDKAPTTEDNKCYSCGECVAECSFGAIAHKVEFMPLINILKDKKAPVFAAVAPSIAGQFGENI